MGNHVVDSSLFLIMTAPEFARKLSYLCDEVILKSILDTSLCFELLRARHSSDCARLLEDVLQVACSLLGMSPWIILGTVIRPDTNRHDEITHAHESSCMIVTSWYGV